MAFRRNQDGPTGHRPELEVTTAPAVAGAAIRGRVHGLSEPADVTLLRIETCPSGRLATPICSCILTPDGEATAFELPVPLATPPVVSGPHCRLSFAVRARSPVSGRRRGQVLVPVEISGGERGVHETSLHHDRIIASFPARHFHIELADAVLEGGGRIQGRVHVADGATHDLEVIARCEESWRINFRFRHHRQPPLWRNEPLWHQELTVECQPGRRWHPFEFTIPAGLPTAVEGHIVCWRYEIEARRHARVGPAERAVVTPLRFDFG
jgi:hypothetical protein